MFKQNNKTKHRPFDSPRRWGFVQVVVVTLEEQEVPSCLSHLPPSIRPSFLAWKSPSISGGKRGYRLQGLLFPTLPGPQSIGSHSGCGWWDGTRETVFLGLTVKFYPMHESTSTVFQMPSVCQALGFIRIISFILMITSGVGTITISIFQRSAEA